MKIRRCRITALMLSAALLLGGCGSTAASGGNSGNNSAGTDVTKDKTKDAADKTKKAPEIEGLTYESTMDLTYATEFDVYYYKDGYQLIDVHEDKQYLIVPKGIEEPENLADDIVGAVVKINRFSDREQLGETSKVPRWAIAFKYPPEEKESRLLNIELSVGRTGRITPTAVFEPVRLCGTSVSRATLHNQDFIDDLDIGIGDTIVVYMSWEIILLIMDVKIVI